LNKYEAVIGLEIHVQLNTKSKAFCADDTTFGAEPNTHTSVVSLAHPGTLPKANMAHIEKAIQLGIACGCEISQINYFDRKNYFYPDLPKGYQITQDANPYCKGGNVEIQVNGVKKSIRLHHIHMEEDAGKSIHDLSEISTMIDLNRAGTPLLEIVTEPDLRTAEEVDALMNYMRKLVRWLDVSDGNMEEGSMRCDCNVSIRLQGTDVLNNRCEIKNMNSMRYARRAIEFEINRQIGIVESGETVKQQTLNFDPETGITTPLRSKEDAHDYRYFPDPDLPPIVVSNDMLKSIKANMPALPHTYLHEFMTKWNVTEADAWILTENLNTSKYFQRIVNKANPKGLSTFIVQKTIPYCKENDIEILDFQVTDEAIIELLQMVQSNEISNTIAMQQVFPELIATGKSPKTIAKEQNLLLNTDTDFLTTIIHEVMSAFPDKVIEYKNGKKGLLGMFVGEVMKRSKGKADPKMASNVVEDALKG
jgi:aspartyl-tRNA(Asn)/glutamyl-tRNA(Gln) amidotransferase subunit B